MSTLASCGTGYADQLVDFECGSVGGAFPILRLADSPLVCGIPTTSGRRLTANTAGFVVEEDGVARYQITGGERCSNSECSLVTRGTLELAMPHADGSADVTYEVEFADGTIEEGTASMPLCARMCL
jgi:hypothetical protein